MDQNTDSRAMLVGAGNGLRERIGMVCLDDGQGGPRLLYMDKRKASVGRCVSTVLGLYAS